MTRAADWPKFTLDKDVIAEDIASDRLVVWLRLPDAGVEKRWQRIGTVVRGDISVADGWCSLPAFAIEARERKPRFFGRILAWVRGEPEKPIWRLPDGSFAEQLGRRQADLRVVWAGDGAATLDESTIRSRWPECQSVRRLGANLFAIRSAVQAKACDPACEIGERLLSEARRCHDRRAEISALTDLGFAALRQGDVKRAADLLTEAVDLSRLIADRALEAEALGYLAATALEVGRPERALQLAARHLAFAVESGDRFAQKLALERVAHASLRLHGHHEALAFFERALSLALELDDRRHAAELLWSLAIEHAALGQRDEAGARGQAAVELWEQIGSPIAGLFANHLDKYRRGETLPASVAGAKADQLPVAHGNGDATSRPPDVVSPSWLTMAFSAARTAGKFLGSGLKTVPAYVHRQRVERCAACSHHTGLRCRLCGCFTQTKAWLPHEDCPLRKWPRQARA